MPTGIEAVTSFNRGWIFRSRIPPEHPSPRVMVLIHGWSGDENSMEIFSRSLPPDRIQLFPRGPVPVTGGGYGWVRSAQGVSPALAEFTPVCTRLMNEINLFLLDLQIKPEPIDLCGFSQGAAVCYALAALFPAQIRRIAALAGFLPAIPAPGSSFSGKSFYIAHGTQDETIPIELARESAAILEKAGATVQYCEGTSGHKLSANCYAELRDFFA